MLQTPSFGHQGDNILSTYPVNGYSYLSGTSMVSECSILFSIKNIV